MFKSENILLFVLVLVCLLISVSLLEATIGNQDLSKLMMSALERIWNTAEEGEEYIFLPQVDGWVRYENEGYAFEIQYPGSFLPKEVPDQNSLNAGVELPGVTPVWEFELRDPDLYQGTTLVDASVVIHVSRGAEALAACEDYKTGSLYKYAGDSLPRVDINQITFIKDIVREGVMGGFYDRVSYRTIAQEACYELTEIVHSRNPDIFPENTIVPYDTEGVLEQLGQVVNTFNFTGDTATFPEMIYPDLQSTAKSIDMNAAGYADGIDVSHWQGDIGWIKVANAGYSFAFVKGTEGTGWTDSKFFTNMAEGENAGVYLGVYHFARPDLGNTGREEAEYFLSVAGDYLESGYLVPVLDLEVRGSLGKTALSAWVIDWMQTVENRTGIKPLIYTNLYYVNTYLTDAVTANDLWIAYWNCDPTVTYSIPPTGKWDDWAFWQYCVEDPGYVPGITTRIDLDIYNGSANNLSDYDAASLLWVSLTSDTRQAPAPYYADLTANVNGDAEGVINYSIWWDCESLSADQAEVVDSCGFLPDTIDGECASDEVGMKCLSVSEEIILAEHTYPDVRGYTPKVIIERGQDLQVEDRAQIIVTNPITGMELDSELTELGRVDYPEDFNIEVMLNTSVGGALQVEVINELNGQVRGSECVIVAGDSSELREFSLPVSETEEATVNYSIWSRYRPLGGCPVVDTSVNDRSLNHGITWTLPTDESAALYSPSTSKFFFRSALSTGPADTIVKYGAAGEGLVPLVGDWNGNGTDTMGVYMASEGFFAIRNVYRDGAGDLSFVFGPAGLDWIPLTGDWNGNGQDTIGLFNPSASKFYLKNENASGPAEIIFVFGPSGAGWQPIAGDWDDDGVDTVGLFNPLSSTFYLINDHDGGAADMVLKFGPSDNEWIPIAGDWDNDGDDSVGLYNPENSKWYLINNHFGGSADSIFIYGPGVADWYPLAGTW